MNPWHWLVLVEHELLLFAGICFLLGALDDIAMDLAWFGLRLSGRGRALRLDLDAIAPTPLKGQAALFVPAWREARVIGDTIAHALGVWPQDALRVYIGCYRNDAATVAAAMKATRADRRVRLVIHDFAGPSTKADCLNRLYRALCDDETRCGTRARIVVFHDAEDMVDPAGLVLLDRALGPADFAQLPVVPAVQPRSRWLGSHYCEEFAEAHGKAMVVRSELHAELPAAGVGCAVLRQALSRLVEARGDGVPFAADSLTEDYELGIGIGSLGGKCRFLRVRGLDGRLVATRAFFPSRMDHIVRQKTRWMHGIALQGWDRLGWTARPGAAWMRLHDRRGPFTALVLFLAYALLVMAAVSWLAARLGSGVEMPLSSELKLVLALNLAAFGWRAAMRFAFTAREYGIAEGLRAVLRIPMANLVAIMAGRRAMVAYVRTLMGGRLVWEKTPHDAHPARATCAKGQPAARLA